MIRLNEDAIETAYWEFDAERKSNGMERDAFKHQMRKFARATVNKELHPNSLHIYAQRYQNDDAQIIGTKDALINLRDLLTARIDRTLIGNTVFFTNDGEGYTVMIEEVDSIETLDVPYTDYLPRAE